MSKTVTTVCGHTVNKTAAKLIAGKYYLPGVSCFVFEVNGKERYYRIDSPYIAYDYSERRYNLKKRIKHYGVVGVNPDSSPIFGRFSTASLVKAMTSENGVDYSLYPVLSEQLLEKVWPEDLAKGDFYDPKIASKHQLGKRRINYPNLSLAYNADNQNAKFLSIRQAYEATAVTISEKVKSVAPLFLDYSFGIEFETVSGTIPMYKLDTLGLVPLRDGSISGYEYTTVPLRGAKGIQTIVNICEELQKRCTYDHTCSMHVHFGNIDTSPKNLVALYTVCRKIQNEMFELVPVYKKDPVKIAGLRKNYCQMLEDIGISYPIDYGNDATVTKKTIVANYARLFTFVSGGGDVKVIENPKQHPQGEHKWNRLNRYFWVNFIPTIYDNKTLEFRLHAGTFNYDKVLLWMLLCIAIIEYTKKRVDQLHTLRTLSLNTIIEEFASMHSLDPSQKRVLKQYVEARKKFFAICAGQADTLGKNDVTLDSGLFETTLFKNRPETSKALLFDAFYIKGRTFRKTEVDPWIKKLTKDSPAYFIEEANT